MDQSTTPQNAQESGETGFSRRSSDSQSSQVQASLSVRQDLGYYQQWLEQQCELISTADTAILLMPLGDDKRFQPVALWPEHPLYIEQLNELVEQVIESGSALVTAIESPAEEASEGERFAVAYPVHSDQEVGAVVALSLVIRAKDQLQQAMRILQWSGSSIELLDVKASLLRSHAANERLQSSVDLLASVMSEPDYDSAAMRLVTELAVLLNCDRVSLGAYKSGRSKIEHLSHSTQFGKRMNLVRCIEEVMDECADQQQCVLFPQPENDDGTIVLAHQHLSEQQGDACVLSVPLYRDSKVIGALAFERHPEIPFTPREAELCESIAALVIPALEDKRLNDRSLFVKIYESSKTQLTRLLGPGYLGRKITLLVVLSIILFFTYATGSYRLSAEARLDSYLQRVVAAPYDGYIRSAVHRAGDVVKKGQVLVNLDDRDLHLEKLKWLSEKAKLVRQYQEALAVHDRAKINIINAQQDQVDAQLNLVESQLARAELTAPFDGLIVSGDLSQRLGGAVEQGEVLFAVSPLHFYRINLLVKESRIADVAVGQTGSLHLSALPEKPFDFVVTKVTPLTEAKDGASYFVVEASLQGRSEQLQPGMEGIGKIYIDERRLISIWSRGLTEWLRLQIWSWWG